MIVDSACFPTFILHRRLGEKYVLIGIKWMAFFAGAALRKKIINMAIYSFRAKCLAKGNDGEKKR